jgi:hypothetical protein
MRISLESFFDELTKIAEESPNASNQQQEWRPPNSVEIKELLRHAALAGLGSGIGAGLGFVVAPKVIPKLYEKLGPEKFTMLMGVGGSVSGILSDLAFRKAYQNISAAGQAEEERRRVERERQRL